MTDNALKPMQHLLDCTLSKRMHIAYVVTKSSKNQTLVFLLIYNFTQFLHLLFDRRWCRGLRVVHDYDQKDMTFDSFHCLDMLLHRTASYCRYITIVSILQINKTKIIFNSAHHSAFS